MFVVAGNGDLSKKTQETQKLWYGFGKTMVRIWKTPNVFMPGLLPSFCLTKRWNNVGLHAFCQLDPSNTRSLSNFKSSLAQVKSSPSTQTRAMDSLVVRQDRKWNLNRHSCTWHQKWESLTFISPCCQTILANLAQNRPHVLKLGL